MKTLLGTALLALALSAMSCSKGAALPPVDATKGAIYMNGASGKAPIAVGPLEANELAQRLNAKRGWKPSLYAWKSVATATLVFQTSQTVFDINADGMIYAITKGEAQSHEVQDAALSRELLAYLDAVANKKGN